MTQTSPTVLHSDPSPIQGVVGESPSAVEETQPTKPRPTVEAITVTLKQSLWTENPRGTYEVDVSVTCLPDRNFTAGRNLDAIHELCRMKLRRYLGEASPTNSDGGGA